MWQTARMPDAAEALVPVFIPPLRVLLRNAERQKGMPLTEEEVTGIRDAGVCIMLPAGHPVDHVCLAAPCEC